MGELMPTIEAAEMPPRDASERRSVRRETLRLLFRKKEFVIGVAIMIVWVICAVGGTAIAPHSPQAADPLFSHAPPVADGGKYLLGTDRLGRDVLSRVIVGARDVLIVA